MSYPAMPCQLLFEIYEDMVQILLMLKVLFKHDSEVKDLFCGASLGSEPRLFLNKISLTLGLSLFKMTFSMTTWMTDEDNGSVILAEL